MAFRVFICQMLVCLTHNVSQRGAVVKATS